MVGLASGHFGYRLGNDFLSEVWAINLLSNFQITVSDEHKRRIVDEVARFLREDRTGIIEISGENGTAFGLRSDSIVSWIKLVTESPSPIIPATGLVGLPGNPLPANGG